VIDTETVRTGYSWDHLFDCADPELAAEFDEWLENLRERMYEQGYDAAVSDSYYNGDDA